MAKAAKSDRQKVIDDIKKKQKGAEKRRGMMIVGVCVVIALLIVGAAAYRPVKDWWELRQFNDVDLASIGAPASVCGDVEKKSAEGESDHRTTGEQITYEDAPPAFGPHWNEGGVAPAPIEKRFYTADDRPELEALVHNLEHGYTILWYDETIADDAGAMDDLRGIASKLDSTTNLRDKFKAVPWTSEDGEAFPKGQHVAFTHWSVGGVGETDPAKQVGVWQYCSEVSGAALDQFMEDYPYMDSSEPAVL